MGERVTRYYENRGYDETPYAAPLALRAVRASVVRRRNPVVHRTDQILEDINARLDEHDGTMTAPTPPAIPERPGSPEQSGDMIEPASRPEAKIKLATVALLITEIEHTAGLSGEEAA